MIIPDRLRRGDKIAFIAPARKIKKEELETAVAILEGWGLEIVYPDGLFLENNQFAGADEDRINHIQWCLDNPSIKALLCVRGGYGTSRIIDRLNFSKFLDSPKWVIGFSDITVLLNQIFINNIQAIHGPVAMLLAQDKTTQDSLKTILFDNKFSNHISAPYNKLNQLGVAQGELVGGNLSVLVNLIGTDSFPNLNGKILFVEDLDEYLYHIDRMMVQLDRSGIFNKIAGLVVGYMSGMHDNSISFGLDAYQIISSIMCKYQVPVGFNFPIGHEPLNLPVVVGSLMELEVSSAQAILRNI
jgi:muramoyltetrapeptide carboxypeptidase